MSYQTKYNNLILVCFKENSNKTMTASQIKDYLNSHGENINIATVYRNLKRLVDENKLVKININESTTSCYQLTKSCNSNQHIHLRCNQCGKLIHLDCEFMDELKMHVKDEHGFNIQCKDSVIYGICNECQRANELKKSNKKLD